MIDQKIIQTVTSDMQAHFTKTSEHFSATRDVFTARMQSYIIETNKYLESAIIGEIGNNTSNLDWELA
jgi:hypothetical protein